MDELYFQFKDIVENRCEFCEKDGSENPLLWLCGAKATKKIGSEQPDRRQESDEMIRTYQAKRWSLLAATAAGSPK